MSIRLVYIGHMVLDDKTSPRLWDVISPRIKSYKGRGYPTMSLELLKENGLIQVPSND